MGLQVNATRPSYKALKLQKKKRKKLKKARKSMLEASYSRISEPNLTKIVPQIHRVRCATSEILKFFHKSKWEIRASNSALNQRTRFRPNFMSGTERCEGLITGENEFVMGAYLSA